MKTFYVYVMASRKNGTLYIGVTNDIARRVHDHRLGVGSKFVRDYGVTRLVYFENYERVVDAIAREKALKKWRRQWKIELIESANPDWDDWYLTLK